MRLKVIFIIILLISGCSNIEEKHKGNYSIPTDWQKKDGSFGEFNIFGQDIIMVNEYLDFSPNNIQKKLKESLNFYYPEKYKLDDKYDTHEVHKGDLSYSVVVNDGEKFIFTKCFQDDKKCVSVVSKDKKTNEELQSKVFK